MALIVDEVVGEFIGAMLEDKFPSMKETTPESEAIESPNPAMAGIGGGSALAIALREVIKRSKGASGGDKAAKNIAGKIAVELGVEHKIDDLVELSKRAMASEEAADILAETLETRIQGSDFAATKNSPKGRDIKGAQEFLINEGAKEGKTAARSSRQKQSRFQKLGEELSREADLDPDLPPPAPSSGTAARKSGAGVPDVLRGETIDARSPKGPTLADADVVDVESKPIKKSAKSIGSGVADISDDIAKSGLFTVKNLKRAGGIGAVLAGIGAYLASEDADDGDGSAISTGEPDALDLMGMSAEETADEFTGEKNSERVKRFKKKQKALDKMKADILKNRGSN